MNSNHNNNHKFLYVIIVVLSVSLIGMGILTFASLYKLMGIQKQVTGMETILMALASLPSGDGVTESNTSAEEGIGSEDTTPQTSEVAGPAPAPQEEASEENSEQSEAQPETQTETQQEVQPETEGTLSSSGSTDSSFSNTANDSMNNLIEQIKTVLPQNNGSWAVYVSDLSENVEGTINDSPMQAASLIKLFIMGTVYENYTSLSEQHGSASLNSQLSSMITVSDNDSANTLVSWLGNGDSASGMAKVNDFCARHNYTSTSMGRLLLQSNENGDNYTSVSDCGKFMKDIYQTCNGTATSPQFSESEAQAMYYLLKMQTRRNKIPAGIPEGIGVANKTGELSNVENDAAIIYDTAKGRDLVVCFMSENLGDTPSAQNTIAQCSHYIYGYYNEQP